MVTLEDIAREANVSFSTVSRALADSPLVNGETKGRVQQIARDLGYRPNQVARSLATRSTRTLGLIVPEVHNPYYPKLIQLFADQVRAAGYSLQLHLSNADQSDERACLQALRDRRADGILLVSGARGLVAHDEVQALLQSGVPLVLMGWVENAPEIDLVMGDDAVGARAVTEHLITLGHRRIVLVGSRETRGPYDRLHGFESALRDAGLDTTDSVLLGVEAEADVPEALRQLMARPEPPTALFAYQDSLAAWILRHLARSGVAVPDQMAVVGFDNLDLATYVHPPLTTVDYPMETLVDRAVALLLGRTRKEITGPPQRHIVTPRLIVRQSCGAQEQTPVPERSDSE